MVIGGKSNRDTRVDEFAGRRKLIQSEEVVGAGDQRSDGVALRESWEVAVVHMIHVIERRGVETEQRIEWRLGQLANMGADTETMLSGSLKDFFGIGGGER